MSVAERVPLPAGTVTLMFTDMEASTELARACGAEAFSALVSEHQTLIRAALARHDGIEIDTAGDGFFAVFATARGAVAAAVDAQRSLRDHDWSSAAAARIRIGIHTGEPHRTATGYSGVAVHRAARICAAGNGGQILLSSAAAGIVEDETIPGVAMLDLGEHMLRGLAGTQRLAQLVVDGLDAQFGPLRTADDARSASEVGTFLLTDLAGWRQIVLRLGDAVSASLMADYQRLVGAAISANDGTILEQAGDEATSVFVRAGDAIAAVDSLRASLTKSPWSADHEVSLCGAVHSGHWSGTRRNPEAGTAMYRLRQLAQIVRPGQILISSTTAALLDGDPLRRRLHNLGDVPTTGNDATAAIYELTDPR